ncbi:MAG TPA: TonB-dependent receptor [Flavisolibacter sp.]|nr:TonB-dependent receptor [Flavisolibacter sp.]
MQNVTLDKVFREIKKQSGYLFLYKTEELKKIGKVSVQVSNATIDEVVSKALNQTRFNYRIIDKTIVLEPKPSETVATTGSVNLAYVEVTGTVTDDKGQPLVGASITVKGTKRGTVTDANGAYRLTVYKGETLVISNTGFEPKEIVVQDEAQRLNISLKTAEQRQEEVIVVGYGTQKKATVTGALTTVTGKEILKSPSSNVTNSLVGRLTGLSAVQRSGQPGNNEALINIRGNATYNNNAAIVVIDGVERSGFGDIDPNEIETITVLKDAASTAVFGIKGANGVIVITTKTGREGKPRISYSGNLSFQSYTGIPKALNAYDNAFLINEANRNDGIAETWAPDELQKFKDGSDPLGYPDINWFDYLTRKVYPQTQHNINVGGGTKVVKYFASIGYLFEDGIFKEFESPYGFRTTPSYNRYNFRSNVDFTLNKDLTVGVRLGGKLGERYQPAGLQGSSFSYDNIEGMLSRVLQTPSFAYPVTLPDGRIAQNPNVGTNIWNPYAVITRWGTREDDANTLESTFNLNYKLDRLIKGLSFKTVFGYDTYFTNITRRNAVWAAYVIDRRTKEVTLAPDRPRDEPLSGLNTSYSGYISSNLQVGFNYDRSFGVHNVTGLVLGTRQKIDQEGTGLNAPPRASQGVVGRVTYNYNRKYFLEFNAAYNGSEQFAIGKQYGFFPAVSAGWTLSNEDFMRSIDWVSNLRIRGSYGLVGNDKLNSRFLFLDNYSVVSGGITTDPAYSRPGTGVQFGLPTSLVNYQVVVPSSFGNPEVTWEKGIKRNIGLEASFFRNALSVTVDLFDETRTDILTNRSSGLAMYGLTYPALNIGEVYNKGYEVEVNYQQRRGEINWGLMGQLSYARNKIISRDEPPGRPDYLKQEGKPVGQFFGFLTDGFYTSEQDIANSPVNTLGKVIPGDLKFKDYNGDKKIDADDIVPIGYSRTPEYIFSLTPSVSYKGLSLSVLLQGVTNVSSDVILSEQNNGQQMYEFQLNRWTPATAATATWPALHSRGNSYLNYRLNDFILQDGSYVKVRNVELSWNLPQHWLRSVNISGLRVYVSGANLYTWTKYKMYLDPENVNLSNTDFSKQSIYPSPRILNFGVNVQL